MDDNGNQAFAVKIRSRIFAEPRSGDGEFQGAVVTVAVMVLRKNGKE